MKLTLQHQDVRSTHTLDAWVEKQIFSLEKRLQIDEAQVRLVRRPEGSPPYAVHVHLVTPGPDVVAEGEDHTLRAAVAKAMERVRDKITQRSAKRHQRRASGLALPANAASRTGCSR